MVLQYFEEVIERLLLNKGYFQNTREFFDFHKIKVKVSLLVEGLSTSFYWYIESIVYIVSKF